MKALDIFLSEPLIRQAWTAHEAFRRLHYPADDIFVVLGQNIAVMLKEDDKEFIVNVGVHPRGSEWFGQLWSVFVEGLQEMPQSALDQAWAGSVFFHHAAEFLVRLRAKGFEPRGEDDHTLNWTHNLPRNVDKST